MAETTIEWTATRLRDGTVLPGYTFNPWIGCQVVSPACDNCYAETQNSFRKWNPEGWGAHAARKRTSAAYWKKPLAWNREAGRTGIRRKVFCASLADVFDNHKSIEEKWRADLFQLIKLCKNLDFLLLTKRPSNISRIVSSVAKAAREKHETQAERKEGLPAGGNRRTGDRSRRPHLAGDEKNLRQVDGGNPSHALSSSAGRTNDYGGISSSEGDGGGQASSCGSGSTGVASLQRGDSARDDHKPLGWAEGSKQSSKSRTRELQQAAISRNSSSRSKASRCEGIQASKDQTDRGSSSRDAIAQGRWNDGEGFSSKILSQPEGNISDMSPENVDPYLDLAVWLENWLAGAPPENVWLGTTVENQEEADRRIPHLLSVPAKVHFLSMEPLLGPVDLKHVKPNIFDATVNSLTGVWHWTEGPSRKESGKIDWVITGGESGKNARPSDPDWFRSIRDQCAAAGVNYFHKQNGEYAPNWYNDADGNKIPGTEWIDRMGKKAAGRLLDGIEHNGMPE